MMWKRKIDIILDPNTVDPKEKLTSHFQASKRTNTPKPTKKSQKKKTKTNKKTTKNKQHTIKTMDGRTIKITKRQQSSISHHFNPQLVTDTPSIENPVEYIPTLPLDQRRFASQGVRRSDRIRKRRREPTPSLPISTSKSPPPKKLRETTHRKNSTTISNNTKSYQHKLKQYFSHDNIQNTSRTPPIQTPTIGFKRRRINMSPSNKVESRPDKRPRIFSQHNNFGHDRT